MWRGRRAPFSGVSCSGCCFLGCTVSLSTGVVALFSAAPGGGAAAAVSLPLFSLDFQASTLALRWLGRVIILRPPRDRGVPRFGVPRFPLPPYLPRTLAELGCGGVGCWVGVDLLPRGVNIWPENVQPFWVVGKGWGWRGDSVRDKCGSGCGCGAVVVRVGVDLEVRLGALYECNAAVASTIEKPFSSVLCSKSVKG